MNAVTPNDAAAICEHMNADHGDAVAAYARTYARVAEVSSARMLGIDAAAMELHIETPAGSIVRRIPFDHELTDKDDARETLIAMARHALSHAARVDGASMMPAGSSATSGGISV